jgi:hypothetical protein
VLNFSQCRSFAAARVKNTQLPTTNVERLENPGQRYLIRREISVLDKVLGQSRKDEAHADTSLSGWSHSVTSSVFNNMLLSLYIAEAAKSLAGWLHPAGLINR